jgi:glycosyltransferase involved in cell wall biosynthesis
MTSALVISRIFPNTPQMVHGVFQRFAAQIEALGRVVDRVDCLYLIADFVKYTPQEIDVYRERLSRQWSTNISLTVLPVLHLAPRAHRLLQLGAGIFDFQQQPLAQEANNPQALAAVASALRTAPDLILVHKLSSMSALLQLKREIKGAPVFFDLDDIEHLTLTRRLWRKPTYRGEQLKLVHIPRMFLAEIEAIKLSRRTFICSESDRQYLGRFVDRRHLEVVSNSIRFPALDSQDRSESTVLFVGSMTYEPNALAADTLVRDIWPLVHAQLPGARLVIAGINPELIPSYSSAPASVTFTGFVDDLAEIYAKTRVVCCPISYGGGTRVKIIEAAAYGCAVVATSLAAEGLDLRDGQEIVIRENSEQLAKECVRLLRNTEEARRIGAAAYQRARVKYDRNAMLAQLEQLFRDGLSGSERPQSRPV